MRHSREAADKWGAAVATIGNHFLKMQGLEVRQPSQPLRGLSDPEQNPNTLKEP